MFPDPVGITQPTIDVPAEFICPLCLDLLQDAVATPCCHLFCRPCIDRSRSSGHNKCPLCRSEISSFDPAKAMPDETVTRLIAEVVPLDVVRRRRLQGAQTLGTSLSSASRLPVYSARASVVPSAGSSFGTETLEVVIGHRPYGAGGVSRDTWIMFVSLPAFQRKRAKMIDRIEYELHHNFNPRVGAFSAAMRFRTAVASNLDIQCTSWGSIPVTCTIHWSPRLHISPTQIVHELIFEGNGRRTTAMVDVCSEHLAMFRPKASSNSLTSCFRLSRH